MVPARHERISIEQVRPSRDTRTALPVGQPDLSDLAGPGPPVVDRKHPLTSAVVTHGPTGRGSVSVRHPVTVRIRIARERGSILAVKRDGFVLVSANLLPHEVPVLRRCGRPLPVDQ